MFKKNYRRREVLNDLKFGLKQRFNIKCAIDIAVFVIILVLFITYALKFGNNSYECGCFLAF